MFSLLNQLKFKQVLVTPIETIRVVGVVVLECQID